MLKPFSLIFFVLVLVWLGSIFITSDPVLRIERGCAPVSVSEKVVTAGTQLAYEPWAQTVQEWMFKAEYGCRFVVWKTFYEDRDAKAPARAGVGKGAAAAQPAKGAQGDETSSPATSTPSVEPAAPKRTDEITVAPASSPARTAPLNPSSDYFESK